MDYQVGSWKMAFLHGPNFYGLIIFKKNILESFGSLTRCKSNVDQEDRPWTEKWKWKWPFF